MNISEPLASVLRRVDASVLRVLARTPAALSGRQVARLAGDSNAAGVRLSLLRLAEAGLVEVSPRSDAVLYTANRSHVLWPMIEEGLAAATLFERRLGALAVSLDPPPISLSLYGSVARGESDEESDVDLFIVFSDEIDSDVLDSQADELRESVSAWTGNDAQPFTVRLSELTRMNASKDPIVANLLDDARTICGTPLRELVAV